LVKHIFRYILHSNYIIVINFIFIDVLQQWGLYNKTRGERRYILYHQ